MYASALLDFGRYRLESQADNVRCPGDTIHSGYQEYIRLILLLSKRQITDEEIKRSESWTPYRL